MPADAPRKSYRQGTLGPDELDDDPLRQLERWLRQAADAAMPEPNAMSLATVDDGGRVSSRMVLLKGVVDGGLEFYSNYESRKGRDLQAHPQAAACFWWDLLERQVRVEGRVARLPEAVSDAYFAGRPRGSQIGAWASLQSQGLPDRETFEARVADYERQFKDQDVPRPPHWGGYLMVADRVEFWYAAKFRLHERVCWRREGGTWTHGLLYP